MAFDVLFNFLSNVENLRSAINRSKEQLFDFNRDQIKQAQQLADALVAAESETSVAAQKLNKELEQQVELENQLKELAKTRANLEKGIGAKGPFNPNLIPNALKAFDQQTKVLAVNTAKQAADAQVAAAQQALQGFRNAEIDKRNEIELTRRKFGAALRDQQENIRRLQVQEIAAVRSQQELAGAGISLIQGFQGVRAALGSILTSFSFGGPGAAGKTAAVQAIGAMVAGFTSLVDLVGSVTKRAFEFSQELESSKIAMAGIIAQTAQLVDAQGNIVPDTEKFNASLQIASGLQEKLLGLVLKTNITFKEAQTAVQAGIGFLLAKGVQPNDAADAIVRLTSLAKSLGIEGARAAFQIRSVFTGTRSQLATVLQSVGLTRQVFQTLSGPELTNAINNGTKFLAQGILKTTDLLKVQIENVSDTISLLLARAFDPAGSKASAALQRLLSLFTNAKGQFTGIALEIQKSFSSLFDTLESGFEQIFTPETIIAFTHAVDNAVKAVGGLTKVFVQLISGQSALGGFFDFVAAKLGSISDVARGVASASKAGVADLTHPFETRELTAAIQNVSRLGREAGLTGEQIDALTDKMAEDFKKARQEFSSGAGGNKNAVIGNLIFDHKKVIADAEDVAIESLQAIASTVKEEQAKSGL